jgi:hypothetical protein
MDIYDGADWTEMDIDDLKAAIESGSSVQEAVEFLCRADRRRGRRPQMRRTWSQAKG